MDQVTQCNMPRQEAFLLSTCLLALAAGFTLALPPGAPWTNFVPKPVYSRALGPPSGIDTISVPYVPKSPVFPKFVDPKMFISKKTDMLSNLFGGLGPAAVTFGAADTVPIIPYGASGSPDYANAYSKRDAPQDVKEKAAGTNGIYKRGMFGPFAPQFGPIAPKFGPMTPFSSAEADYAADYLDKAPFSRKRRTIEASSPSASDGNSITGEKSQATGLGKSKIVEGLPVTKSAAGSDTPKEYLPGMFGPFGPGGPYGPGGFFGPASFGPYGPGSFGPGGPFAPAVDPSAMIAKKSGFLDTLFKNLATSTPATTTDVPPTPKSTIVPPSFWIPSSVIPGPTEYTSKVSDFLDKLFDSLKINATTGAASDGSDVKSVFMRSLKPDDVVADKVARSLDDVSAIAAAKDEIVDAILSELGDLKGDMITTLNDLIAYEKATAAAASPSKKPFKPFSGMFPFAKPTVDPTLPFKQRMAVLSQVFDMLTELQRNVTAAAKNAIATSAPSNPESSRLPETVDASPYNITLLDAILNRISAAEAASPGSYPASFAKGYTIASRALPKGPTSFWVSYPESPAASAIKRDVQDDLLPYLDYENDDNDRQDRRQYTRGVQMQMHQGYQSLPAGSVESVQAGGGSTPEHQGGGIKLLDSQGTGAYGNTNKWSDWAQYHRNEYEERRHHHNHH